MKLCVQCRVPFTHTCVHAAALYVTTHTLKHTHAQTARGPQGRARSCGMLATQHDRLCHRQMRRHTQVCVLCVCFRVSQLLVGLSCSVLGMTGCSVRACVPKDLLSFTPRTHMSGYTNACAHVCLPNTHTHPCSDAPERVYVSEPCRDVRSITAMAVSLDRKYIAVAESTAGTRPPQVCA